MLKKLFEDRCALLLIILLSLIYFLPNIIEGLTSEEPSVDEKPVDGEPVDEKPVDGEPVDEKPVNEEPVDEKPVKSTENGSDINIENLIQAKVEERVVKDVPLEPMPTPLQSLPPSDESILDKLPLIGGGDNIPNNENSLPQSMTLSCLTEPVLEVKKDISVKNENLNKYENITEKGIKLASKMSFPNKYGNFVRTMQCESPLIRTDRMDDQLIADTIIINVFNKEILGTGDKDGNWRPIKNKELLITLKNRIKNNEWWRINQGMYVNNLEEGVIQHVDDNRYIIYGKYDGETIELKDPKVLSEIFGDSFTSLDEISKNGIIDKYFPSKESLGDDYLCKKDEYIYTCKE